MVIEETNLTKYKVLKALTLVRQVMAQEIEVDETYLGGNSGKTKESQSKDMLNQASVVEVQASNMCLEF